MTELIICRTPESKFFKKMYVILPLIFQMRKLRLRDVKQLARVTAGGEDRGMVRTQCHQKLKSMVQMTTHPEDLITRIVEASKKTSLKRFLSLYILAWTYKALYYGSIPQLHSILR